MVPNGVGRHPGVGEHHVEPALLLVDLREEPIEVAERPMGALPDLMEGQRPAARPLRRNLRGRAEDGRGKDRGKLSPSSAGRPAVLYVHLRSRPSVPVCRDHTRETKRMSAAPAKRAVTMLSATPARPRDDASSSTARRVPIARRGPAPSRRRPEIVLIVDDSVDTREPGGSGLPERIDDDGD